MGARETTGNGQQLNWVEKQHMAEKHLAGSKPGLWRDVCSAMTDASRSFNKLYAGASEAKPINGHRFRVVAHVGEEEYEADIDFDDQSGKISAAYNAAVEGTKHFQMRADHISAFIVDDEGNRITPDGVSRSILKPLFFPEESGTFAIEWW
jgi:hypothetical protein